MPTDKKAIAVYLNEHLYELVARAAKAQRRSISNYVEKRPRIYDASRGHNNVCKHSSR